MGEFLSTPNREKVSEDGENDFVNISNFRSDTELLECKDGEKEWKTLIFLI
jgi:hypothetical protein